jgi:hypothetical protein
MAIDRLSVTSWRHEALTTGTEGQTATAISRARWAPRARNRLATFAQARTSMHNAAPTSATMSDVERCDISPRSGKTADAVRMLGIEYCL